MEKCPDGNSLKMIRLQRVVVVDFTGRLGNRLILLSHLIAAGMEYGFEVWNLAFKSYADGFEAFQKNDFCMWPESLGVVLPAWMHRPLRRMIKVMAVHCPARSVLHFYDRSGLGTIFLDSDEFAALRKQHRNLVLWGYDFRCPNLVEKHGELLRNLFRPSAGVCQKVDSWKARSGLVGKEWSTLHVRRGDYREFEEGRYYYQADDYHAWVDSLREMGRPVVVCGDDEEICRELASKEGVLLGPGEPFSDLFAMSESTLIAGPPSTFSGWAGWRGGKKLLVLSRSQQKLSEAEARVPELV